MLIQLESGGILNLDNVAFISDPRGVGSTVRLLNGQSVRVTVTPEDWTRLTALCETERIPPPELVEVNIEDLRNQLEEFGVTIDKRWSRRTLLEKIEEAKALENAA